MRKDGLNFLLGFIFFITRFLSGFCFESFDSRPYITPTETPGTALWLSWNTLYPDSTIVAYGSSPALEDTFRRIEVGVYHHVRLEGLTAGSRYYYRILPQGELGFFETAASLADSFYFLAIGDTRTDSAVHQSLIDRMAGCRAPFFLHVGDLINDGDLTSDWQTFFNIEDTLMPRLIFLPVIGNHEYPYDAYDTLFPLPEDEEYYSFTYANSFFIGLNTESDLSGSQKTWLTEKLIWARNNPAIDWIIVFFHRPPYSSGVHGSQLDVQQEWCPLFEQYAVDLVFCGHDHDYERTNPINGVIYVITGGGGAPLHPVGSNPWTAYAESTYQFCRVQVRGRCLKLWAVKPDGSVFDSLFIDKPIGYRESGFCGRSAIIVGPNPFNHELRIIGLGQANARTSILVFNHQGRCVRSLAGTAKIWLGDDDRGQILPAGVYFLGRDDGGLTPMIKVVKLQP